jgi:transcriptional regulator with XRE-family HTH domain
MGSPTLRSETARRTVARNVRALLAAREWSENELARRSGVSQKQVNNITHARTGCGIDALDAIARTFNTAPWVLLVPEVADLGERYADVERGLREALAHA